MDDQMYIRSLIRDNISGLVPYSSARDEYSGSALVYLDANENPYNAPLNRYPDPGQRELKEAVAGLKNQQVDNLFLGNGSDEGIDLLIRVLCNPGQDNVVTVEPTYGMYGVCAHINDVEQKQVLLGPGFSLDPDAVIKAADRHTKIIFMCSPNNPTSNAYDRGAMMKIVDSVNCIVVVDEAYIDFSTSEGMLSEVPAKANLVVLQTLSKAWGLAGIRLGMVFGHPELIRFLSRVKYPYNINTLTLTRAIECVARRENRDRWIRQILEERDRLSDRLGSLAFVQRVYPSDANFLLVRVKDPFRVYRYLLERGIVVRDRSAVPLCEGCLRITAGTKKENQALYEALKSYGNI